MNFNRSYVYLKKVFDLKKEIWIIKLNYLYYILVQYGKYIDDTF